MVLDISKIVSRASRKREQMVSLACLSSSLAACISAINALFSSRLASIMALCAMLECCIIISPTRWIGDTFFLFARLSSRRNDGERSDRVIPGGISVGGKHF